MTARISEVMIADLSADAECLRDGSTCGRIWRDIMLETSTAAGFISAIWGCDSKNGDDRLILIVGESSHITKRKWTALIFHPDWENPSDLDNFESSPAFPSVMERFKKLICGEETMFLVRLTSSNDRPLSACDASRYVSLMVTGPVDGVEQPPLQDPTTSVQASAESDPDYEGAGWCDGPSLSPLLDENHEDHHTAWFILVAGYGTNQAAQEGRGKHLNRLSNWDAHVTAYEFEPRPVKKRH